jgi:hypothetical protein
MLFSETEVTVVERDMTTAPSGPGSPHYRGFTITLRHTTLSWTPLNGYSARRRNFYLPTHNTHKREISMPGRESNETARWLREILM